MVSTTVSNLASAAKVDSVVRVPPADLGDSLAIAALALARRFAAGATLWCLAPHWPEHARHVAVEFVHPVVVGKRALPAVSVLATQPQEALRSLVRAHDVIVVVSPGNSETTTRLLRRANAWGLMSIWIGVGDRSPSAVADHSLWVGDGTVSESDRAAPYDGRLVLIYHLLWELTHICFEHPGLLAEPTQTCDAGDICTTCSDEGRMGEVLHVAAHGVTKVRTARGIEVIDATMVDPLQRGDIVLIHAGVAIALVP